jgi:hypothetical protein
MYMTGTYTPNTVRIFSPSLHTYDGVQAQAEMIVEHTSKTGSMSGLLVCIPISNTAARTNASVMLEEIIKNAPKLPNVAESLTLSNFNMNSIIPSAPYYTYSGPLPYDACAPDTIYQYVVFHPSSNGALAIDDTYVEMLRETIFFSNISSVTASTQTPIFFNPKGTTQNGFNGEDQIYIQCQPAGESEETEIYKDPVAPGLNLGGGKDETVKVIMYIILGALFIIGSYLLLNFITKEFKYTDSAPKGKPGASK